MILLDNKYLEGRPQISPVIDNSDRDGYSKDDTLGKDFYDGGVATPSNLIKGSAILAGSVLAYKTGLLKPIIKQAMKGASKLKGTGVVAANDLRKWFASDGNKEVEKSMFRLGVVDTIKEFTKLDKENAKNIIKHTKEDIYTYNERLNRSLRRIKDDISDSYISNTAENTGVLHDIKYGKKAIAAYSDNMDPAKRVLKSKINDTLIKNRIISDKKSAQQMKQWGYSQATIGDMFKTKVDKNGYVRLYEKTKFKFDKTEHGETQNFLKQLEETLNTNLVNNDGIKIRQDGKNLRLFEHNKDFKKMVIDDAIFKDSKGGMIDLRNQKSSGYEFIRNLATEWQIPAIRVNPLQMFGVDKIGKRSIPFATISEDTIAPFLTGVRGNTVDHTIKALKDKVDVLNGVEEGVTIINGEVFRINDSKKGIVKMDYKSKKNVTIIPKDMDHGNMALTHLENSQRIMGGLSKKQFIDYTREDGAYKYYKQKVAKFFDIGYQESNNIKESIEAASEYASPDGFIERAISKLRPKPYKDVIETKTFSGLSNRKNFNNAKESFFVTNDVTTLKDVAVSRFNSKKVKDYAYQYVADYKHNYESVNNRTGMAHFMLDRLNNGIGTMGLALSTESTGSAWDLGKNLILKRMLPVYGAYQAYNFINMVGEGNTDNGSKPGNLDQHIKSGIVKMDIGFHNLTSKLGIDKFTKRLGQLTPGSDMIMELPGLNTLNLDKSGEERSKYWKDGYSAVRKGRWWSLNSTPFVGGKISYWKPNMYRSSLADAKYSDSLYGSRKERFFHMLSPNYYDKRNYNTRPYLMTSPALENIPLVGPILAGTVGKAIAPQRMMHPEYWNSDAPKGQSQLRSEENIISQNTIAYAKANAVKSSNQIAFNSQQDLGYIANVQDLTTKSKNADEVIYTQDQAILSNVFKFNSGANTDFSDESPISNVVGGLKGEQRAKEIYMTNSGAMSTIGFKGPNIKQDEVNINKNGYSLGQIMDVDANAKSIDEPIITGDVLKDFKMADPTNPNSLSNSLKDQYLNASEVTGMYGFLAQGFVTGKPDAGKTQIETSGWSRSFNKEFWDQDAGGLSGDLSEIFRRFIQNKRTDINYYNPIRNRMPDWLPGANGFIDFQHGDPYNKVAHGEERLPGEGYERLNHISMPDELNMDAGANVMGKTRDQLVDHFLHRDLPTDEESIHIKNQEGLIRKKVGKQLEEAGLAIDHGQTVTDEKNGVSGVYDAKMHDRTSLTGEAIMNVYGVNDEEFQQLKKGGAPRSADQGQVNWLLHQTNILDKGYTMYVNIDKDDELDMSTRSKRVDSNDETLTFGFNYSHSMYKTSMETLKSARIETADMLHKGTISRADFYSPMDKYRVLADVAPYSDEFKALNKMMSNIKLTTEEHAELTEIRDRVAEQRQNTRFYNYRFKNSEVIEESGKIGYKVDNQTFILKGSGLSDDDSAIKLAGLTIVKGTTSESIQKYNEAEAFIDKHMGKGSHVKILAAEDESQRNNGDMLKSTKAVVIADGMNINHELIKRGLAKEDDKDFSAAGVHARFNMVQRGFGKAWESFAHMDTLFHTKLLQVRTASEDYERKQVYNKDFKSWNHPVKDFLEPFVWTNMNRTGGIAFGAAVGYLLGRGSYGKLLGSIAGGLTIGIAKTYKAGYEAKTGEHWVPGVKRKQRDMEDYMDKLKFVKNRKLFEVYAEKALKEDKFDVKKFIMDSRADGETRKQKARNLTDIKKDYKETGKFNRKAFEKEGVKFDWKDLMPAPIRTFLQGDRVTIRKFKEAGKNILDFTIYDDPKKVIESTKSAVKSTTNKKKAALEKTANDEININTNTKKVFKLSKNAMKAIEYYNNSESTMYGYDPGEPLTNLMSAMPKADKNYFRDFLKAPVKEREKILQIAPKYMKRALQSAYGMKVDDKEDLNAYFGKHMLPGENWDGWQENYDLESMKVKMVQQQGMSLPAFNKWQDDKRKADLMGPAEIPNMGYQNKNVLAVKSRLEKVLSSAGYKDLNFSFQFGASNPSIDMKMYEDRKEKFDNKLRERLGSQ